MRMIQVTLFLALAAPAMAPAEDLSQLPFPVWNVVPPLYDTDDPQATRAGSAGVDPVVVTPFEEHVRRWLPDAVPASPVLGIRIDADGLSATARDGTIDGYGLPDWAPAGREEIVPAPRFAPRALLRLTPEIRELVARYADTLDAYPDLKVNDVTQDAEYVWLATSRGLFQAGRSAIERHGSYGVNGPLATDVTAVAADSEGALWTGSPAGLAVRNPDGVWRGIRGRDGLPVEDVTAIAVDGNDRMWIGTSNGLIHYRPYEEGRQWFYREGERYLPDNHVYDIVLSHDGATIYTATEGGLGRLDVTETTLKARAETIEQRVNERHRRLGMVASCRLDDAVNPSSWEIRDNDNDGLWTAYHVVAMSLAYAATGDPAAKASAREGMHALYMLQNASGTPGLVARSVVPLEKAIAIGKDKDPQWRLTPDGTMYWKSDTSSDEIDGHYFAFYAYWEHIAKDDPEERVLCEKQVRALTDYIVGNDYLLIDWDGEHTRWGFWNPHMLNHDPTRYLENGLNSLQMLSFLKTAYHITGDDDYQRHYMSLITDHHYLANVLLEKKTYPDSDNHSDNQLAYVAWYPILQLEQDPQIRAQLRKAVRRHYKIIDRDRSSFFYFVTATIDPGYVDLESAVLNLKRIPTDRRQWRQTNSHRADVIFNPRVDRFGKPQLMEVLPADERAFDRWNANLYLADDGSTGRHEDAGADYLLPYWLARYHGFLAETE